MSGTINLDTDGTLALNNPITVTGGITNNGTVTGGVTTGGLQLTDGGTVSMSGGTIAPAQSGETLNNVDNKIVGFGAIGTGSGSGLHLNVHNQAGGTIEASGGTLTIKNFGNFNNAGTMKADLGATLDVHSGAITNSGNIHVQGVLALDNPNSGDVSVLTGAGTVTLSGGTIDSTVTGESLTNAGNTILGYGLIGSTTNTNLSLNNASGTINATGGTLTLDTGASSITNAGTLEATSGATLAIDSNVGNSRRHRSRQPVPALWSN